MKRAILFMTVVTILAASLAVGGWASDAAAKESNILEFSTMIGVPRPYTGAANAIRGINGGGLPWVVNFASGELKANGKLEVTVHGLVLDPNDAVVNSVPGRAGTNPIASFKAIVSCMSKDANGNAVTANVSTGLFPADAAGNSVIESTVALPQPCIAPIVFVTNPGGAWFAVTGN
jgi:hypothetical protein